MAKTGYRFNPETLSYDKVHKSWGQKVWYLFIKCFSTVAVAIVIYVVVPMLLPFDTPKEMALKRANEETLAQFQLVNSQLQELDKVLKSLETRDDNIYRVIFESEPIDASIRRAGTGGVDRYAALKNMDNAEIIMNVRKKLDELSKAAYIQSRSYDEVEILVKNKFEMLASIPAIPPVSLKNRNIHLSSSFGYRIHPRYKTTKLHTGMDFAGAVGTPVYATGDGTISRVEMSKGYGRCVEIDHGFTYKTLYAHLDSYNVKKGQKVKRGDIIGYLGNTGVSTGPHVHYEVRKNNIPVDPINYYFNDLSAEEYDQLVTQAANNGQSMD